MEIIRKTTVDRVISKLYRDLGLEEINEGDVIEWIGEAVDLLEMYTILDECVSFQNVKDYTSDIPCDAVYIIQIAKDSLGYKDENCKIKDCIQEIKETPDNNNCNPIVLDCRGRIVDDTNIAYFRPFILKTPLHFWINSTFYRNRFIPLRLSQNSFFSVLKTDYDDNDKLVYRNYQNVDEFKIENEKIYYSFKEGRVAISYLKKSKDENTGYPLIPDDYYFINALFYYVGMKHFGRLAFLGREGYFNLYQKFEKMWYSYAASVKANYYTPKTENELENLFRQYNQIIPRLDRFDSFFGLLPVRDSRLWSDSYFLNK